MGVAAEDACAMGGVIVTGVAAGPSVSTGTFTCRHTPSMSRSNRTLLPEITVPVAGGIGAAALLMTSVTAEGWRVAGSVATSPGLKRELRGC